MSQEEKFEEIYNKIVEENLEDMEKIRKGAAEENKKKLTQIGRMIFLFLVIYFIVPTSIRAVYTVTFAALLIFAIYKVIHKNGTSKEEQYTKTYKNKIIKTIINSFDENLEYMPQSGISSDVYKEADFESYDKYESDDFVLGKLENGCNFTMSEVMTKNRHKDSNRRGRILNCV